MRAFDPEVFDAVWTAAEPLLPVHDDRHPLGCHRLRAPDRECFRVMVVRLVTGVLLGGRRAALPQRRLGHDRTRAPRRVAGGRPL